MGPCGRHSESACYADKPYGAGMTGGLLPVSGASEGSEFCHAWLGVMEWTLGSSSLVKSRRTGLGGSPLDSVPGWVLLISAN